MFNPQARQNKEAYLRNGNWKCAKSGTGSHHWKSDVLGSLKLVCVHCNDSRAFSLDFSRNPGWQGRKKNGVDGAAPATEVPVSQ